MANYKHKPIRVTAIQWLGCGVNDAQNIVRLIPEVIGVNVMAVNPPNYRLVIKSADARIINPLTIEAKQWIVFPSGIKSGPYVYTESTFKQFYEALTMGD